MYISETQNFPIVKVGFQEQDVLPFDENIAYFEALLARQSPFVLLSEGPFPEQQQSHEERKQIAAWVKQKRELLSEYIKAHIHIEADEQVRLASQKMANNYVKFSGYPMFIVADHVQAQKMIDSLLAGAMY
ncbi:hypothetical protein [Acinetobacter larvae]|uniref:Uncharacterized protein n=1 Tax=Acinetobacter larvae TaxID=1789224 RepID=A0A1B2LXM7_9GAMM|nr:hypothetical protein [Acinetobacter larvae]AOA57691.1 hypothetical protein BFG52_04495 [Acinetobacter larvae]